MDTVDSIALWLECTIADDTVKVTVLARKVQVVSVSVEPESRENELPKKEQDTSQGLKDEEFEQAS